MMRLPEFEDCRDLEQLNGGDYFPKKEHLIKSNKQKKRNFKKKLKKK